MMWIAWIFPAVVLTVAVALVILSIHINTQLGQVSDGLDRAAEGIADVQTVVDDIRKMQRETLFMLEGFGTSIGRTE